MQEALNSLAPAAHGDAANPSSSSHFSAQDGYQIIRRSGDVVPFTPQKIAVALTKAFLAVRGAPCCARVRAAAPSISKTCRTRSNWA
jgi:ribonucleoside-diphosphate reductase alpha chain